MQGSRLHSFKEDNFIGDQKFRKVISRSDKTRGRLYTLGIEAENITARRNGVLANLLISAPVFQPRKTSFDVAAAVPRSRYSSTFIRRNFHGL